MHIVYLRRPIACLPGLLIQFVRIHQYNEVEVIIAGGEEVWGALRHHLHILGSAVPAEADEVRSGPQSTITPCFDRPPTFI